MRELARAVWVDPPLSQADLLSEITRFSKAKWINGELLLPEEVEPIFTFESSTPPRPQRTYAEPDAKEQNAAILTMKQVQERLRREVPYGSMECGVWRVGGKLTVVVGVPNDLRGQCAEILKEFTNVMLFDNSLK